MYIDIQIHMHDYDLYNMPVVSNEWRTEEEIEATISLGITVYRDYCRDQFLIA